MENKKKRNNNNQPVTANTMQCNATQAEGKDSVRDFLMHISRGHKFKKQQ